MKFVTFIAHIHAQLGGGKLALFALHVLGFALFFAAFFGVMFLLCRKTTSKRYMAAVASVFAYWQTGWTLVATPLATVIPATSFVGKLVLATMWPVWVYGPVFGFEAYDHIPDWLGARMFNF